MCSFFCQQTAYDDCFKCHRRERRKHHCRCCGQMFCSQCTTKRDVPQSFQKKEKTGPARVCDLCRYLIVKGATLVETRVSSFRYSR
jgi:hypothetical protein